MHLHVKFLCLVFLPILLILSTGNLNAQVSEYGNDFEVRDTVFYDDFNDFVNQWLLGVEEDSWTETFDKGKLYFQSHGEQSKEDVIPIILDTHRDFEIETVIQFSKGKMNQAYGLQFGKSQILKKQYDFFISANGQYSIDKYDEGFTDYVSFTPSEYVNRYAPNKLTIRKAADTLYYFLNETLVYSMPFQPFFGNLMGFQVGANSTILVDYFKVVYLNYSEDPLSKILIIDYQHNADEVASIKGAPIQLTVQFLNAGNCDAEDLRVSYLIPPNIKAVAIQSVDKLSVGETGEMIIELFPTRNYHEDKIKVAFEIEGADIDNASDINLVIYLQNPSRVSHDRTLEQTYSEYRGGDPLKGLNLAKAQQVLDVGNYYALIIGIDEFHGEWSPLKNAVNDAKSLQQLLEEKYEFECIRTLYNEEATRQNILKNFEWFMDTIDIMDNLLIYYSGHGYYSEQMEQGFWVPVDAKSKEIHEYISNEQIRSFMSGIRSKHTLLVSDACFSGDIFRGKTLSIPYDNSTKYYNKVCSLMSRKALTSGGIEPVMDGGRDGHSVFGYYLLKALDSNTSKYMDASELFNLIKIPVVNNSEQTPMYNPVNSTGDEGGQFIFITK